MLLLLICCLFIDKNDCSPLNAFITMRLSRMWGVCLHMYIDFSVSNFAIKLLSMQIAASYVAHNSKVVFNLAMLYTVTILPVRLAAEGVSARSQL